MNILINIIIFFRKNSTFICSIARSIEPNLPSFDDRANRARSFFQDSVENLLKHQKRTRVLGAFSLAVAK